VRFVLPQRFQSPEAPLLSTPFLVYHCERNARLVIASTLLTLFSREAGVPDTATLTATLLPQRGWLYSPNLALSAAANR
jgi:hypothetical protein